MVYKSDQYLYYTILDKLNWKDDTIETLFSALGNDFEIKKGSLEFVEDSNKTKYIRCTGFALSSKELNVNEIQIGHFFNYHFLAHISGMYDCKPIYIGIDVSLDKVDFILTVLDEGLYIYSRQFNMKSGDFTPHISYYDSEACKSLTNDYKLTTEQILGSSESSIEKLGIFPDKSTFATIKDFGFNSYGDFINKITTTMTREELISKFNGVLEIEAEKDSQHKISH